MATEVATATTKPARHNWRWRQAGNETIQTTHNKFSVTITQVKSDWLRNKGNHLQDSHESNKYVQHRSHVNIVTHRVEQISSNNSEVSDPTQTGVEINRVSISRCASESACWELNCSSKGTVPDWANEESLLKVHGCSLSVHLSELRNYRLVSSHDLTQGKARASCCPA